MKKKILFIFGAVAALAIGVVGISAFEARVINVTAHIENALSTSVNELPFGTVFPQEYFVKPVTVSLSESFIDAGRVDDVNYVINQKLKPCPTRIPTDGPTPTPIPVDPTCVPDGREPGIDQPLEGATGWHYLDLCPFLSKGPDNSPRNDTGERSYFQSDHCIAPTPQDGAIGRLSKAEGDFSDTWNIDLKVPPIAGSVGQDWPEGCPTVPTNSATYGCDLWFEVTGISTPPGPRPTTLTVNKVLVPSDDLGKFNLQIDSVTQATDQGNGGTTGQITVTAGAHTVGELAGTDTDLGNYTTAISGDCAPDGSITLVTGDQKICTITNTKKSTTLTVTKALSPTDDPGKFNLQIDSVTKATDQGNGGTTGAISVSPGAHTVGELAGTGTNLGDYTTVIGGDCASNGSITLVTGDHKACSITNTRKGGTITVHKVVNNNDVGTLNAGNFQMTIDGNNVAQDTPIPVPVGVHTVSEVDSHGYTKTVGVNCAADGTVNVGSNQNKNCTVTNTFPFFTVTVTKAVVNTPWNGNNGLSDFPLFVGATSVASGISKNFAPGTYLVSESGVNGYSDVYTGDCDFDTHNISGINGDVKTCTITNTALPAQIHMFKVVSSGTAQPTDFIMRVDTVAVAHNSSKTVTANATHTITEDAKAGYHFVSMSGTGSQGSLCPTTLGGTVTLNEGEVITCTITNAAD